MDGAAKFKLKLSCTYPKNEFVINGQIFKLLTENEYSGDKTVLLVCKFYFQIEVRE